MSRFHCVKREKVWCVQDLIFTQKFSVLVHLNPGGADGDGNSDLYSGFDAHIRLSGCIATISFLLIINTGELFISHTEYRIGLVSRDQWNYADAYTFPFHFLTFLISPFSPFAGSLFPLHFSLFHFRPRASHPPSPSCVWGSSIGYTGFKQYFSFSKKSAVEAHESPLKDVHRPTGGIHPPTPFFVVCHVYSCSLILDPNGNTDFPRVSHVFHFYVCIRTR